MNTNLEKQIDLLFGVRTLGLFTDSSDYYEDFARKYESDLMLAEFAWAGQIQLTEMGERTISMLWNKLLTDYLRLEDEGFEDLNALALAVFERGCRRGQVSY